jgi:hypothetical protein
MKWATITIPGRPPYAVNAEIEQSIHRIQETNSPALFSHNAGKENQANEDVERIDYFKSIGLSDEVIKLIMKGGSHQSGLIAQEAIPKATMARPDKDTLEASRWSGIIKHPSEIVILGSRGSGKTSLAFRIAEHLRWVAPVYVVAFPDTARKYLPDWIGMVPTMEDLPNNCIAIVDEASLLYHARSSMTKKAKALPELINLSRQKNQTIIFVTQESGQIDRNILSGTDVIVFKEPSLLQTRFDRPELRKITEEANRAFQSIPGDRRKWSYVIAQGKGDIGLIESAPPTFWTNQLSHAFAYVGKSADHPAKKLTLADRIIKAKEYHRQGLSLRQIGKLLGVSPATVKNYLDGYPYKTKS